MRMWMCNPRILCRKHLIGEYRELFTFLGSLKKKIKMNGYLKNNLFEPSSLQKRYNDITTEMRYRGYKPKKEFIFSESDIEYLGDGRNKKINRNKSLKDLLSRCSECKKRYNKYKYSHISWNKGLTKKTNPILQQNSEKIKTLYLHKGTNMGFKKGSIPLFIGPSWNKGLTKEIDKRLAITGQHISDAYKNMGSNKREEINKKLRITTLQYLSSSNNIFISKPEIKFKTLLDKWGIKYKHNYPIWDIEHCYPVDFFLPEYNTVIEIDGIYWHNFPDGTAKDILRENELARKGIFILRFWENEIDAIELEILKETLENFKLLSNKKLMEEFKDATLS